jgi:Velvet factor
MHRITLPATHTHGPRIVGVFAFTDLSVRQEGHYRLRFDVFEISSATIYHRAHVISDEFRVYAAKSFPGMAQSTDFTDTLKKHGIRVRVSKTIRNNGHGTDRDESADGVVGYASDMRISRANRNVPYDAYNAKVPPMFK